MAGVLQTVHGTILVCEPAPFWTPALQRELQQDSLLVRGCRTPNELDGLIAGHPHAMIVYDLNTGPAGCLGWLASRKSKSLRVIVCGMTTNAELEPVCRELGARSFIPDLISHADLAALCRRWLRVQEADSLASRSIGSRASQEQKPTGDYRGII